MSTNRTLVIHKALNGDSDLVINITGLQLPTPDKVDTIFENEGKDIAQALFSSLPSATIIALMAKLDYLANSDGDN